MFSSINIQLRKYIEARVASTKTIKKYVNCENFDLKTIDISKSKLGLHYVTISSGKSIYARISRVSGPRGLAKKPDPVLCSSSEGIFFKILLNNYCKLF